MTSTDPREKLASHRQANVMLSRVAASLYWMSRYLERAENIARLLDVNLQISVDFDRSDELRLILNRIDPKIIEVGASEPHQF